MSGRGSSWRSQSQLQVRNLAMTFGALDEIEELSSLFDCPSDLSQEDRNRVEKEEGWILGVR